MKQVLLLIVVLMITACSDSEYDRIKRERKRNSEKSSGFLGHYDISRGKFDGHTYIIATGARQMGMVHYMGNYWDTFLEVYN